MVWDITGKPPVSSPLHSRIPNTEAVLALAPEQLAGVLLEIWNEVPGGWTDCLHNFGLDYTVSGYPKNDYPRIKGRLQQAWAWLVKEGMIIPGGGQEGWYVLSDRGKQFKHAGDLDAYQRAEALPRLILHPVINQRIWNDFRDGDYESAIFKAFREVEIAVRDAGKFTQTDLGVDLMRKAFNEVAGPLTDQNEPLSERQALSHLFAGAIGRYKNPSSHRPVSIEVDEAVEAICLASRLMKIVDLRR
jgi:uncharacterized protein (TIGR02391 family)